MNYIHRADCKIPKWIDDAITGKINKKASSVNTVMMPYGLSERATQLKSNVIDAALESMQVEEWQDDDKKSDIEKRIEEAKTPEELAAIEKELSASADAKTDDTKTEDKPVQNTETPAEPTEKPEAAPETSDDTTSEIEALKNEVKDLKGQMDKLTGEEKLKHEVDLLKEKLDNISPRENPNLNETIYQTASSKVKYFKRALRRIRADHILRQIPEIKDHSLNIGDVVFLNNNSMYAKVKEKNGKKYYEPIGLTLPHGIKDKDVKIVKDDGKVK